MVPVIDEYFTTFNWDGLIFDLKGIKCPIIHVSYTFKYYYVQENTYFLHLSKTIFNVAYDQMHSSNFDTILIDNIYLINNSHKRYIVHMLV